MFVRVWQEYYREGKGSMREGDAIMERMIAKCDKNHRDGENEEEFLKVAAENKSGKEEFMKEVMEAVRLTRQPTPINLHVVIMMFHFLLSFRCSLHLYRCSTCIFVQIG